MAPNRKTGGWMTAAAVARATVGKVVRTGRAAQRVCTDSRELRAGDLFVALRGERFDGHDFVAAAIRAKAAGVVVDRAIRLPDARHGTFVVRTSDTGTALMALANHHRRRNDAKVIGITGSCGKTSTKDMLGEVLAAAMPTVRSPHSFNNQVGVPLSLLQIGHETRAAVVEMGTNAPGEISMLSRVTEPDIGILTCVSEAHLKGLGDLGGVAREKAGLFHGLRHGGVAILNGDDQSCRAIAATLEHRVVFVSVGREADWFATDVRFHGLGTSFRLQGERPVSIPRLGSHNVHNSLLCIAAARELGVDLDTILAALCRLPSTPRRLEHKLLGDVQVFDDTYNMNPASARAALAALAGLECTGRKIVVFGEMAELGERAHELHVALGNAVAESQADLLLAVGPVAWAIGEGALHAGMPAGRIVRVDDPTHALAALTDLLGPGDLVLCKASRRVGLDRLVDGMQRQLTKRAAEANTD